MRFLLNKSHLVLFLYPFFYWVSYVLLSYYVSGDQVHYARFYEGAASLGVVEAYNFAKVTIDASEPLSVFLLWLGSSFGIDKGVYISFYNACLWSAIFIACLKYRSSWLAVFLILVNFYVLVLLTGAERLKFGYLFMVLALLIESRWKIVFFAMGVASHFQMLLLVPSVIVVKTYEKILPFLNSFTVSRQGFFVFLVGFFVIPAFIFLFLEGVLGKFLFYVDRDRSIFDVLDLFILLSVALIVTRNWKKMLLAISPFFAFAFAFGAQRINMLAVTVVIWLLLTERRLTHPLFAIFLIYFSVKSVVFVSNIYVHGHGFP